MRIFIVRINEKIFKAFAKGEDAEKYYDLILEFASRKLIKHLASYNIKIDLISIPVDEDDTNFGQALHKTAHAGAGSSAISFEYEPFPIL